MLDDIDDIVIFAAKAVEKVRNESAISDRSVNVGKEIRYGLQLLAVSVNCKVSDLFGSQIMIQLQSPRFFIVAEEVFNSDPYLSGSPTSFECTFEEIFGQSAIDPKFHQTIAFSPSSVICIRWEERAVEVTRNIKALAVG